MTELAGVAVDLIGVGLAIGMAGEVLRRPLGRFVRLLRGDRPIERLLLDVYLGGAVLLGLAYLPPGLFFPETVPLLGGSAFGIFVLEIGLERGRGASKLRERGAGWLRALARPGPVVALGSAGFLFLFELWLGSGPGTGNTYDSSLFAFYVAHLITFHSLPTSFLPSAATALAYPQGTTVWLAAFQIAGGLDPSRVALLTTPLFIGLAPLGAFALGDRLAGRPSVGVATALVMVLAGSTPRLVVAGHNDFLFSLPLVLLLFGWSPELWSGERGPPAADTLAFGALAGIAATYNPTGPVWLLLSALGVAWIARRGRVPSFAWCGRWVSSIATGLVFVLPNLLLAGGATGALSSPSPAGPLAGTYGPPGISPGLFLALANPFQWATGNLALSPFLGVEFALALLLGAGAILLATMRGPRVLGQGAVDLGRAAAAGVAVCLVLLLAGVAEFAEPHGPLLLVGLVSLSETSLLLMLLFTCVAAWPIAVLFESGRAFRPPEPHGSEVPPAPGSHSLLRVPWRNALLPWGLAAILLVPGAVTTAASVPTFEHDLYHAFGNVTDGDFAMLQWAEGHLPAGARVLVAPGTAGEFLIGYAPRIVLLFPMIGGAFGNLSYATLNRELRNGTLDEAGASALATLQVDDLAFSQSVNVLFPHAWQPAPFLAPSGPGNPASGYALAFHEGDAYVFART